MCGKQTPWRNVLALSIGRQELWTRATRIYSLTSVHCVIYDYEYFPARMCALEGVVGGDGSVFFVLLLLLCFIPRCLNITATALTGNSMENHRVGVKVSGTARNAGWRAKKWFKLKVSSIVYYQNTMLTYDIMAAHGRTIQPTSRIGSRGWLRWVPIHCAFTFANTRKMKRKLFLAAFWLQSILAYVGLICLTGGFRYSIVDFLEHISIVPRLSWHVAFKFLPVRAQKTQIK